MDPQNMLAQFLQGSGAAQEAKALLRSTMAKDMIAKLAASGASSAQLPPPSALEQVADSIAAQHLKSRGLRFTLSTLAAEDPVAVSNDAKQSVDAITHRLAPLVIGGSGSHAQGSASQLSPSVGTGQPRQKQSESSALTLLCQFFDQHETIVRSKAMSEDDGTMRSKQLALTSSPPLSQQLEILEARHRELMAMSTSGQAGATDSSAMTALRTIRQQMEERHQGEMAAAVASARADEASRVRAEERARYDRMIAQQQQVQRQAVDAARGEDADGGSNTALARARDEVVAAATEARSRLVGELDRLAINDSQLRRAAALDSRAFQLERDRHEDEVRRLMNRVRDSEEAARSADVRARLALERWKSEWLLGVEGREAAVAREENRLREARQVLEEERRGLERSSSAMPGLAASLAQSDEKVRYLQQQLEEKSAIAKQATQRMEELQHSLSIERERADRAVSRMESAEAEAATASAAADQAATEASATREEWGAAVRMLRDRLAAASTKLKANAARIDSMESEWSRKLDEAVTRERAALTEASRAWSNERARLASELVTASEAAARETRRADEASAALVGANARLTELDKTVAVLRASSSSHNGLESLNASYAAAAAGGRPGGTASQPHSTGPSPNTSTTSLHGYLPSSMTGNLGAGIGGAGMASLTSLTGQQTMQLQQSQQLRAGRWQPDTSLAKAVAEALSSSQAGQVLGGHGGGGSGASSTASLPSAAIPAAVRFQQQQMQMQQQGYPGRGGVMGQGQFDGFGYATGGGYPSVGYADNSPSSSANTSSILLHQAPQQQQQQSSTYPSASASAPATSTAGQPPKPPLPPPLSAAVSSTTSAAAAPSVTTPTSSQSGGVTWPVNSVAVATPSAPVIHPSTSSASLQSIGGNGAAAGGGGAGYDEGYSTTFAAPATRAADNTEEDIAAAERAAEVGFGMATAASAGDAGSAKDRPSTLDDIEAAARVRAQDAQILGNSGLQGHSLGGYRPEGTQFDLGDGGGYDDDYADAHHHGEAGQAQAGDGAGDVHRSFEQQQAMGGYVPSQDEYDEASLELY